MPRSTKRTNSNLSASKQSIPPLHTPAPKQTIQPAVPVFNSPQINSPQINSPSMLDTMKQGFFFGVGSSIAHNIFNSKNKEETINTKETINNKLTTDKVYELYNKCLEKKDNTINCNIILENA
jgi:hypothetical protein